MLCVWQTLSLRVKTNFQRYCYPFLQVRIPEAQEGDIIGFKFRSVWFPSLSSSLWAMTSFNSHSILLRYIVFLSFYNSGDNLRRISVGEIGWGNWLSDGLNCQFSWLLTFFLKYIVKFPALLKIMSNWEFLLMMVTFQFLRTIIFIYILHYFCIGR